MKLTIFSFLIYLFSFTTIFATQGYLPSNMGNEHTMQVNNKILTTVNGTTISVVDVMKKLDILFYKYYPELVDSHAAKFQFYSTGWKEILTEMINTELILADAKARELQLSDGEIREEMENRFGPNILINLEKIGLTYQEAWDLVKKEMIVMRMTWAFINNKAIQSVTPQVIRQSYQIFCKENPPKEQWQYQLLSISGDDKESIENIAKEIYEELVNHSSLENYFSTIIQLFEEKYPTVSIQLSKEYKVDNKELSSTYKDALASLDIDSISKPLEQVSRTTNKTTHKIFYLKNHTKENLPTFEKKANELKNQLIQKEISKESKQYFTKLRKKYGFDEKQMVNADFEPFILR